MKKTSTVRVNGNIIFKGQKLTIFQNRTFGRQRIPLGRYKGDERYAPKKGMAHVTMAGACRPMPRPFLRGHARSSPVTGPKTVGPGE